LNAFEKRKLLWIEVILIKSFHVLFFSRLFN
jgi:hypothetical protein